jgi:nucleotide-binding universal stress UspA family protein
MQSERSEASRDLEAPAPALPRGRSAEERVEPRGAAVARILVCVDRSSTSEAAAAHAANVAVAFDAEVTLLHVIESRSRALEPADALGWEITRAESQQYLDRLQTELAGHGVPASTVLAQGHPAEQILTTARDRAADLIVMTSHGEHANSPWNLGGTAEKVLSRAATSVLLVPTDAPPEAAACEHILIPLDGSQRAECVLPAALGLARAKRATIGLAHVVREPELFRTALPSAEDIERVEALEQRNRELAGRYLEGLAARLRSEGIEVRTFLERGDDVHRELNELAAREGFDLIALAAHGHTGAATRAVGSTPARLADGSRPLLVIQGLSPTERRRAPAQVTARRNALRLGGLHHDLTP